MKILFIHSLDINKKIGGAVRCHELAHSLSSAGHSVDMLVCSDRFSGEKVNYKISAVPVFKFNKYVRLFSFEIALFFMLLRRCFGGRSSVVYIRSYLPCLAPLVVAKMTNTPILIEENGFGFEFHLRGGEFPVRRCAAIRLDRWMGFISRRMNACVFAAKGQAKFLAKKFKLSRDNTFVVPNGADTHSFHPVDQVEARDYVGCLNHMNIGVFVGHLYRPRGVYYLIEMMRKLRDENIELMLLIVGDGPEMNALKAAVEEYGLTDWVRFCGFVDPAELKYYISAADFCFAPFDNTYKGVSLTPLKLYSYLACGRPIILSDVPVDLDEARLANCSRRFEAENITALAECALELIQDTALCHRMGEHALSLVKDLSWTASAQCLSNVINEVVIGDL